MFKQWIVNHSEGENWNGYFKNVGRNTFNWITISKLPKWGDVLQLSRGLCSAVDCNKPSHWIN